MKTTTKSKCNIGMCKSMPKVSTKTTSSAKPMLKSMNRIAKPMAKKKK